MQGFAIYTPGCMVHVIGNAAFAGATIFMPESDPAHCDFPGGSAEALYGSIIELLPLPYGMRLLMCHGYGPNGCDIAWETSVGKERLHNIHVGSDKTMEDFVMFRIERDVHLAVPRLIIYSLKVNMRSGIVVTDDCGKPVLTVPVNGL